MAIFDVIVIQWRQQQGHVLVLHNGKGNQDACIGSQELGKHEQQHHLQLVSVSSFEKVDSEGSGRVEVRAWNRHSEHPANEICKTPREVVRGCEIKGVHHESCA